MLVTTFDVVVVGMGPTGAALSGLLGQRGLQVLVVDRLPDLYPLPRAVGLDHDVMRLVQELGVAGRVEPHVSPYRPSEYLGVQGQPIRRLDAAPPPHRHGWAPNYVFEQPAFERILRGRLDELPGVTVRCSTDAVSVGQDDDGAWADVVGPDGTGERVHAQYVVACDGGTSPVRKQLGIELDDLGFDEPWLVVDVIVDDEALARLPETQVQYCEPDQPCTYVVGVGSHRRWEVRIDDDAQQSGDWPEAELWPLLKRWIGPGEGRIWRSAAYRFHGLVAQRWRSGRVLLAGDSAHMTPPFMAQGMAQGMRDAQNLAWKLERVVRGDAPDSLLDSYERERKPHVTATTRTAMALGRVICERDPDRAAARDLQLLAEQGGVVQTVVRQTLIPPLLDGFVDSESPGAGTVLPQPFVTAGAFTGRLDDLTGARVRVVVAGGLSVQERAALARAVEPVEGVVVEFGDASVPDGGVASLVVQERDALVTTWLASIERRFAVVRPDHYVYSTADTLSAAVAAVDDLAAGCSREPRAAAVAS